VEIDSCTFMRVGGEEGFPSFGKSWVPIIYLGVGPAGENYLTWRTLVVLRSLTVISREPRSLGYDGRIWTVNQPKVGTLDTDSSTCEVQVAAHVKFHRY